MKEAWPSAFCSLGWEEEPFKVEEGDLSNTHTKSYTDHGGKEKKEDWEVHPDLAKSFPQ